MCILTQWLARTWHPFYASCDCDEFPKYNNNEETIRLIYSEGPGTKQLDSTLKKVTSTEKSQKHGGTLPE